MKPKILLFDEPLSNLDSNLRQVMREKIRVLQQQLNITAVYVTHDQSEAFAVSDQIVVMDKGQIVQQGSPEQLYQAPKNQFIAQFMGEASFVPAKKKGAEITVGSQTIRLESTLADGDCRLGIRPEAIQLSPAKSNSNTAAKVLKADYMGAYWELHLDWQGAPLLAKVSSACFEREITHYEMAFAPKGLFLLPA